MLPQYLFATVFIGGAFAGATSHVDIDDHATVPIRRHLPFAEASRDFSDFDAQRRIDHSKPWWLAMATKKLTSDGSAALFETATEQDVSNDAAAAGKQVGNLVRSENTPEVSGIDTLYNQLKNASIGSRWVMLKVGSIGFLMLLFGFVVHFTTQQFSKIRSHGPSFTTPSSIQKQRLVQSKPPGISNTSQTDVSAGQSQPLAVPSKSQPGVPPVPLPTQRAPSESEPSHPPKQSFPSKAVAQTKMQGVPKARAIAGQTRRSSSIMETLNHWYDVLGFSDEPVGKSKASAKVKAQPKPKAQIAANSVSRLPSTPSETQSDSSSETSSSEATSHEEQPRTSKTAAQARAGPARRKETPPPQSQISCYPWHTLPTSEMLLSVGPTFHVNLNNAFPDLLRKRGLHPAGNGKIALVALWNWPGQRQRALAELCLRDTLANKRTFATHLAKCGLQGMAPLTFLNPAELRNALKPKQRHSMPKRIQDGLWFLKHAVKDNNLGVTCFQGVHAMLNHWEGKGPNGIRAAERLHYVAQYEVQKPLLFTSMPGHVENLGGNTPENPSPHKVTIRGYVLILGTGRCFLHRELLLKAHPQAYDANDPDPLRHILCHSRYDGVVSARGTDWSHYGTIWPRIADMMRTSFRSFDFEVLQDEAILDDEFSTFYRAWNKIWQCMATLPFLRSCMKRRKRGIEEADSMKYALLGLDVVVDENLRPWCLELNRSPTLVREVRDPTGSQIKDDVVEDFCELLIDPLLRAAARAACNRSPQGPWGKLQQWAAEDVQQTQRASSRGFVELSLPEVRA